MSTGEPTSDRPGRPPGARRRGGPRPGHTESRRRILSCARSAFAANGYAGTSMRGIAREAEVDPSLVVHFFGSKAGLFAAVVEWPFDPPDPGIIAATPVERLGALVVHQFLANWEQAEGRTTLISHIQVALGDAGAAILLRDFITTNFTLPVVRRAGSDQPELRAALLSAQLLGVGLARYALSFAALAEAPVQQLAEALSANAQRICTGPLPPASS